MVFRVIGKVLRGTDAGRLLYYLYGPGRANEHTDPHLVAGFGDPAELEPERRPDGRADLRRLTRLLAQPLAALKQPGYPKPVWHCSVRAAPGDRMLSDAEWARVAEAIMEKTGLARAGDEAGVRWVAVRHAADHVHIVATLARLDGTRPPVWNDFYRVREACREAEERYGLTMTAPGDRIAGHQPGRAEAEKAARNGHAEPARITLRREVCTAAAGASSEREFFARLADAGIAVRERHSDLEPLEVTGYAVGLPGHTSGDGQIIWYGGGKLAADLTLPKLRARWALSGSSHAALPGSGLPGPAARAVLRNMAAAAAEQAHDEAGFLAELERAGALVRLRYSQTDPGQLTGYAIALPGHVTPGGEPIWHGGGKLDPGLSLPRLRRRWNPPRSTAPERSGASGFTTAERDAITGHAERLAATATEHITSAARRDPDGGEDAARAVGDLLRIAAAAGGGPELRHAADIFDRAARARYGRIPPAGRHGDDLRSAARLLAITGGQVPLTVTLIARLAMLAVAVAELRQAQDRAAQADAARAAVARLRATRGPDRPPGRARHQEPGPSQRRPGRAGIPARVARLDFPAPVSPAAGAPPAQQRPGEVAGTPRRGPRRGPVPGRAGPAP